ncbi:MAG: DUF4919 domain-containing protein [Bacteroidaceae bacterium]|nr:DUF4919 domain-containing protein [Bacteroidaceae bacterium]
MKKLLLTTIALMFMLGPAQAQDKFDYKLVKEIVDNERTYFNDILKLYLADDELLRTDDVALVYYGHSYMPEYKGGNDINEKTLKAYVAENNYTKTYETSKKILTYNPVSLNALFYAWLSSQKLAKPESEVSSYVNKYLRILEMITTMGDGKSSRSPFRVINPDDQDHVMYGILDIENVNSRNLDTRTLCNIVSVTPSSKFPARTMYFDVSRYLSHTSKKK